MDDLVGFCDARTRSSARPGGGERGGRTDVVDHAALKGLQLRQESGGDGGSEALMIGAVALAYKRPVASRCTYVEDRAEALGDLTACAMGRDEQVRSC